MERMKRVQHAQQESVSKADAAKEDFKKSGMIREESSSKINIGATANECIPNIIKNESLNAGANNEEKWLKPATHMPIKKRTTHMWK